MSTSQHPLPCTIDDLEVFVADVRRVAESDGTAAEFWTGLDDHTKLMVSFRMPEPLPPPKRSWLDRLRGAQ